MHVPGGLERRAGAVVGKRKSKKRKKSEKGIRALVPVPHVVSKGGT